MKVKDLMITEIIMATLPGNRTDVLRILVKENKTGIPVIKGKDKALVGFVTRQDIIAKPEEEQLALIINKNYPTLDPDDSIEKAAKILLDNDIHHLPVVENDKLKGIITPADFLQVIEKMDISESVDQFIRYPCVPIYQGAPLPVADSVFRVAKIVASPVLNEEGRLCGIVTDRDLFNLSTINVSSAMSAFGLGEDENAWTWEGLRNIMKLYFDVSRLELPNVPVKEVMIPKPKTVFRKTSVSKAARIMKKYDYGQLPIRDSKDRLISMIYDIDLLAVLAK